MDARRGSDGSVAADADDRSIKAALIDEFDRAHIRRDFMSLTVASGVVHLSGATETEEEREAATIAAEQIPGVTAVENELAVMSVDATRGFPLE